MLKPLTRNYPTGDAPERPFKGVFIVSPEIQAERLADCESNRCGVSMNGMCKACCGAGTPHETIGRLNVSRCAKKIWKR